MANVLDTVGDVTNQSTPRVAFDDVQCSSEQRISDDYPGAICLAISQGNARVGTVIEFKTPWIKWTSDLKVSWVSQVINQNICCVSHADFTKGQLVQYISEILYLWDAFNIREGNCRKTGRPSRNFAFAIRPLFSHRMRCFEAMGLVFVQKCHQSTWRWS